MEPGKTSNKLNISLDLRIVCIILLVVIAGMLAMWQPWKDDSGSSQRKITISGEATLKAEPDEFVFYPSYTRKTLGEITTLSQDIVKKLKELGVADNQIKTNASSYDYPELYAPKPAPDGDNALSLTVTINKKDLAQKVQDYLLTTNPIGSITPIPNFSTEKRKQLEDEARDKAIADAKSRADKTADGLDAKIGKVVEVKEGVSGGGIYPLLYGADSKSSRSSESLPIQPGENEFSYRVEVVFELR